MRWVCEIAAVIPLSLRDTKDSPQEQFDLKHLSTEQKQFVENLLSQQNEVFSKGSNDIGHMKDFKMQIELSLKIPVSEPYRKIPKLFYDEVKNHINNLLTNGWIRKSKSPYASPMVCVRKKDGGFKTMCGLS